MKNHVSINGVQICTIDENSIIEINQSNGNSVLAINSNSNSINISSNGYVNQGVHKGADNLGQAGRGQQNIFDGVRLTNSTIIVDGQAFNIDDYANNQPIKIEIVGNINSLSTQAGDLNISANNIGTVSTMSGDINVTANSVGACNSMTGDIMTFK